MRLLIGTIALAAGMLLTPADARAQDGRWAPWLGCWELVNENVRDATTPPRGENRQRSEDTGSQTSGASPRVCVERSGEGVSLTTTVPEQEESRQTIVADGVARPIDDNECRGTEASEWSNDGQRLYARAEVTCADGSPRAISGLAMLTPEGMWLDVRSFRLEGQPTTRVSRYRRIGGVAPRRLPIAGGAPLTLAAIKEASTKVSGAVLEAAVAETNPFVPVNKQTLADLADAGVAPSVIDVVVALAYPEEFVVERADASRTRNGAFYGPFGLYDYYYSGFYYPSFYYSPFGYSYIGRYDPFFFRPIYSGGGGRGDRDDRPSGTGRVIAGQGYTRVRPADSGDGGTGSGTASPRTAVPRGTATISGGGDSGGGATSAPSGSSGSGSSSGSSGSGSSGGSASPGGFSGGGDGGGGRTAQPR